MSKQNYDIDQHEQWYERHAGGVLVPVEMKETKQGSNGKAGKSAPARSFNEAGADDEQW